MNLVGDAQRQIAVCCQFCTSHVCAKLMVMADATFISLSVYGKLLYNLANVEEECEIREEDLLCITTLKEVTYNGTNNVMMSFVTF